MCNCGVRSATAVFYVRTPLSLRRFRRSDNVFDNYLHDVTFWCGFSRQTYGRSTHRTTETMGCGPVYRMRSETTTVSTHTWFWPLIFVAIVTKLLIAAIVGGNVATHVTLVTEIIVSMNFARFLATGTSDLGFHDVGLVFIFFDRTWRFRSGKQFRTYITAINLVFFRNMFPHSLQFFDEIAALMEMSSPSTQQPTSAYTALGTSGNDQRTLFPYCRQLLYQTVYMYVMFTIESYQFRIAIFRKANIASILIELTTFSPFTPSDKNLSQVQDVENPTNDCHVGRNRSPLHAIYPERMSVSIDRSSCRQKFVQAAVQKNL